MPQQQRSRGPFQEMSPQREADFPSVVRPVQERSFQPTRVETLPSTLRLAAEAMLGGWPRPVLFIVHGVALSEVGAELTALAERLTVPEIAARNGMGCIPMQHALSLGFISRNGAHPANQAGWHADLVLVVGARFDDRSASSWLDGYSWGFPASALVHVDADVRPPTTGTWALPPIPHKEPAFGAPVRRATPA